jgi:hypothetical protein
MKMDEGNLEAEIASAFERSALTMDLQAGVAKLNQEIARLQRDVAKLELTLRASRSDRFASPNHREQKEIVALSVAPSMTASLMVRECHCDPVGTCQCKYSELRH